MAVDLGIKSQAAVSQAMPKDTKAPMSFTAFGVSASGLVSGGGFELLKWQALTALWVIVFCAIGTYIILRVVKLFVPLRMTEEDMEEGDIAVHGHEVYPSDVPSLGFPSGVAGGGQPAPAHGAAMAAPEASG